MSISPERAQSRYDATKKQLEAARAKLKTFDDQISAKIEISAAETKKWNELNDALNEATCKLEAFDLDPANTDVLKANADAASAVTAADAAVTDAITADNAGANEETSAALKGAQAILESKQALAKIAADAADMKRMEHEELVAKVATAAKAEQDQGVIGVIAGQEADDLISKLKDEFMTASGEVRRLNEQHNNQKAALARKISEYPTALASHLRKCTYTGKEDIKKRTMNTVKEARKAVSDCDSPATKLAASLAG